MNRLSALCVGWLGLFAACSSLPQTHFYRLSTDLARVDRAPVTGVLSVESIEADAAYSDDRMAYRTSPVRLDYYTYHRWAAPPGLLLADYLRTGYTRTGLFGRVVAGPHPPPDALLSGRLTSFDEVDQTEHVWIAQLELDLTLTDARDGTVLWQRHFTEVQPIRERTPEGLAIALSATLDRVVRASAPEIAAAMQRNSQPDPAAPPQTPQ